jgi:hypothetical protein
VAQARSSEVCWCFRRGGLLPLLAYAASRIDGNLDICAARGRACRRAVFALVFDTARPWGGVADVPSSGTCMVVRGPAKGRATGFLIDRRRGQLSASREEWRRSRMNALVARGVPRKGRRKSILDRVGALVLGEGAPERRALNSSWSHGLKMDLKPDQSPTRQGHGPVVFRHAVRRSQE